MSLSNAAENDIWLLIFNNVSWANVGNAGGILQSSAAGSFFIGLATADPGEAGTQLTSEATYTGYARVPVARTSAGFTVSGNNPTTAANAAVVTFGACTAGSNTITHVVLGRDTSGAGEIIASQPLGASLAVSNGITPSFAIGALTFTLD